MANFSGDRAKVYDRMASGATSTIAEKVIASLADTLPISPSSYILDNACGTGLVSGIIKSQFPFAKIKGADVAPGMIDCFKYRIEEGGWKDVDAEVLDCRDLKTLGDNTFSHVITNFGFAPDPSDAMGPAKTAAEMYRVLKPGGINVLTTWAHRNFDTALENTARVIRPNEEPYSWKASRDTGAWLMQHLEEAGFAPKTDGPDLGVEVRTVTGTIGAGSLDELVTNMMMFKDMFLKGYSEKEITRAEVVLKEELKKLETYRETEKGVEVGTVAWIGIGRK